MSYAQPRMDVNRSAMSRFVNMYDQNYTRNGLSKIMAHALFSSLCNPYGHNQTDIYIGAYKIIDGNMNCVEQLLSEFETKSCNMIMICCPWTAEQLLLLENERTPEKLHFVVVILSNNKQIWYYDPRSGLEKPAIDSAPVQGYLVPKSLLLHKRNGGSIIFSGNKRCAFYFTAPLDEYGCVIKQVRTEVTWNIDQRFKRLFQDHFGLPSEALTPGTHVHDFTDVVSLEDKYFDKHALFQNRLVKVKPFYLRSNETGNPIGLGLFAKVPFDTKYQSDIACWHNGEVLCLNEAETSRRNIANPMAQFYTVSLELNKNKMIAIRSGKNNCSSKSLILVKLLPCLYQNHI